MRTAILAILGLSFVAAQEAVAATTEKESTYEIEAIVFENRLPDLIGDEQLARDALQTKIRGLENAIVPDKTEGNSFLHPAVTNLLEQEGHYRVLAHLRWHQTVDAKSIAKPVRVASIKPGEVEGTIRFFMSRHLHLDVNLLLRESVANANKETAAAVYQMTEQRKVKTQETHYFDHPRLGVLVRVMPAQKIKDNK